MEQTEIYIQHPATELPQKSGIYPVVVFLSEKYHHIFSTGFFDGEKWFSHLAPLIPLNDMLLWLEVRENVIVCSAQDFEEMSNEGLAMAPDGCCHYVPWPHLKAHLEVKGIKL